MTDLTLTENWQAIIKEQPELQVIARQILAGSDFVYQQGERHPDAYRLLVESGDLQRSYDEGDYQRALRKRIVDITDETALNRALRLFRQREMVRIIWRDLANWAPLSETVRELSALADACIRESLAILFDWQIAISGTPLNAKGEPIQLVVLGMGKLGAGELNLSSDIDLIFTYSEEGTTVGGRKAISHEEFFTRLGRKLIQALDNVTVDGFVFRVDMRLRPFGDSGALVASFNAMEDYYQTQGREWERYAMIKARPITGSAKDQQAISELLRPFCYRRYLDYGTFDSLREMKAMIAGQLHTKGMEDNIKLGSGGIREIEFIGQVFQLIYGGRDKPLQQRPILTILQLLAERNLLSQAAVDTLTTAYVFLRRTEHRIQAVADQQTHLLPKDDLGRQRLANSMGFESWATFIVVLAKHRQWVHEHFEQLLLSPQSSDKDNADNLALLSGSDDAKVSYLKKLGYADPQASQESLDKLLASHAARSLSQNGQSRIKRLLPLLVQAAASVDNRDDCLNRLIPLLEAIMRRTAYMALLVENPLALSQLVKLCSASPLISHQLARFPLLLDELLDPQSLYEVPERALQKQHLVRYLDSVDEADLEQRMNRLREFRQIATLHVAAADVTGVLPLMRVGDQLTELAEIQLEQVLGMAWQHLVDRHGYPPLAKADDMSHCGFAVIAYGKLGGLELGYGSDLDLVFIFDDSQDAMSDGAKPVDPMIFYTRLGQRMIHLMSTTTSGGVLYEVDMRLRPRGNSGLLVTPFSGFVDYQENDAWTWEHQALVRARCIVGDQRLAEQFDVVRKQLLSRERDIEVLAKEVSEMRQKMRQQSDKSREGLFDLKQGVGGITDIEFLVQYAVLAWSANLPELMVYTDNIRILDALAEKGKLTANERDVLADAYRLYRNEANHSVLQEQSAVVSETAFAEMRQQVTTIWQRWLGESAVDLMN